MSAFKLVRRSAAVSAFVASRNAETSADFRTSVKRICIHILSKSIEPFTSWSPSSSESSFTIAYSLVFREMLALSHCSCSFKLRISSVSTFFFS